MSIVTLKMPRLGETMEEGEITTWLVEPDQAFARGDAIVEVETDKTAVEFPALGAGTLVEFLADEGEMVTVGDPIARIDIGEGPDWTVSNDEVQAKASEPAPPPKEAEKPAMVAGSGDARMRATPVARRIARNAGLELSAIAGTGRRGRIEARDVEAAIEVDTGDVVRFSHDIAYTASGPADGEPYLLLHGFAGDHTAWATLANGLKRAGCRVIAPDLPGHGKTGIEAATMEELAQNLSEFARTHFGRKPFHLVAHSLAAASALDLADKASLSSLNLITPVGLGDGVNKEFLVGMARPQSPQAVAELLVLLTTQENTLSPKALDALFEDLARGRLVKLAENVIAAKIDIVPQLEHIAAKIPVRILLGDSDRIAGKTDCFSLPPTVAVHNFHNTGHMPHWEQTKMVLKILLRS